MKLISAVLVLAGLFSLWQAGKGNGTLRFDLPLGLALVGMALVIWHI